MPFTLPQITSLPAPNPDSSSVFSRLLAPLHDFFKSASHQYLCHQLSDWDWIQTGLFRVLDDQPSGCAFLQKRVLQLLAPLTKSHYFESCKSPRRLRHLQSLTEAFTQAEAGKALRHPSGITNLLHGSNSALQSCLADFHIYAGDGHFHAASSHDLPDGKLTKHAVGHLYALNLRTSFLSHLAFGHETGKKKPHDMEVLKRLTTAQLRQGAGKGEKVLYIWDRAGIDFRKWDHWKNTSGIYFLSRSKTNMKLEHPLPIAYDPADTLNAGIVADQWVSHSQGAMIRRVSFILPETGETMSFLTNLGVKIPPGIVAHLYFMRWRIEKTFDEIKNKLGETKAWAKSGTAKKMQAQFITLAYNLGRLLHENLEKNEDLRDDTNYRKQERRLEKMQAAMVAGNRALPLLRIKLQKATQLSVKFYRWLRHEIVHPSPWHLAVSRLKYLHAHY